MKIQLKPLTSDIVITVYVVVSLYLRFKFEHNNYAVSGAYSIVIGICFVTILWALIKLKFLNPNWFGLFTTKKTKL